MEKVILNAQVCYHCGDPIRVSGFTADKKLFCCAGCKGVYQILTENQLCAYYAYNDSPGSRTQKTNYFDYLDEPSVVKQLIDFHDDKSTIITFYVPAIHCSSCIWLLEHLYKINPSIFNSRIDFLKKQVTISFKHHEISLRSVAETLHQLGYGPSINLQDVVKEKSHSVNKDLIQKIAVAGFCMGNVMLFSFPEYFGLSSVERQFQNLFAWLNLGFCIPVTFYCARDYFLSAWHSLKHRQINLDTPLALIMVVLLVRTAISALFSDDPGFADTLTGLIFLLLMGKWVKQRTYHHISFDRDYRSYFPIAVTTLKNGIEKPKAISELEVGDRLWIRNAELVPADAILMRGEAWLDMSFVTGETDPKHKVLGEIIYAGGKQVGEGIEIEVVKKPSNSYLTSLWNKENYKDGIKKSNFNDSIAKYFSLAVFVTAFSALFYWLNYNDSSKAWAAFTAVIIVACPCVLALSTPFTLSAILAVLDKNGFYVKNTEALEQLANCNSIIFDKTGTLTTAENAVVQFNGSLTPLQEQMVASLMAHSSHPLSRQIYKDLKADQLLEVVDFNEIAGRGLKGMVNHQLITVGNHLLFPTLKVLAITHGVHVGINGDYVGTFSVSQQWREDLSTLIFTLAKKFKLQVLSGDTDKDEPILHRIFPLNTILRFQQSPHHKLEEVKRLQSEGSRVIMLGDGLNDAGALKQSDFGIAITDNVNNFTPGSDAILKGSSLHLLPKFLKIARDGIKIIKISFVIAIGYNLIGLYYAVQGTLYPLVAAILMPLSTITIIGFTSLATRYFAHKRQLV